MLVSARLREGVSATCAPVFGRGSYEHFEFFDFKPKTFSRPLTVGSVAWVVWALGTYAVFVPWHLKIVENVILLRKPSVASRMGLGHQLVTLGVITSGDPRSDC